MNRLPELERNKVLLADDQKSFSKMFKAEFEKAQENSETLAKQELVIINDAQEAIDYIKNNQNQIILSIVDKIWPPFSDIQGKDILIESASKRIHTLFLSSDDEDKTLKDVKIPKKMLPYILVSQKTRSNTQILYTVEVLVKSSIKEKKMEAEMDNILQKGICMGLLMGMTNVTNQKIIRKSIQYHYNNIKRSMPSDSSISPYVTLKSKLLKTRAKDIKKWLIK